MKRPAFLSGFLMMLVGLGLTIAVMFVLPFHKDAAAPCFYLVRMTAVLGFASALAGVMLQFSSAGLAAGIQLMNMLLGIVITLAAAFVIGPCAVLRRDHRARRHDLGRRHRLPLGRRRPSPFEEAFGISIRTFSLKSR